MDYSITYTDTSKTPFTIKPYTGNGPDAPDSLTPLHPGAIAANTSLVLLGKGMGDYGEPFQRDLVHMLENFASPLAPQYAIQGQLWFKNSTNEMFVNTNVLTNPATPNWAKLLIDGYVTADANFGGHKLTNIGTPTTSTDAATKGYVDGNFLPLTGGSLTGNLVLVGAGVTLPNAPSAGTDATNKTYVDTSIASAIGGVTGVYVLKAGDTMSGNLHITSGGLTVVGAVSLTGAVSLGGGSSFNAGGIILTNLLTPSVASDAATKGYVDTSISSQASTDSGLYVAKAGSTMTGALVISAGGLNVTGGITLPTGDATLTSGNLTLAAGTLSVTGGLTLGSTTTTNFGTNVIHNIGTPGLATDAATKGYVDSAVAGVVFTAGADGVTTSGELNSSTGVLTLHRSLSGKATISFSATPIVTPTTSLGIAAGAYTFNAAIDGGAATVYSVTATGTDTMTSMAALMQAALVGAGTVSAATNAFVITSSTTGIHSAVIITIPAGSGTDLVGAINTALTATDSNVSVPSDVVITGTFAPFVHTHQAAAVSVNVDPTYAQSYLRDQLIDTGSFPTASLVDVVTEFDGAVSGLKSRNRRTVIVANGTVGPFGTGFEYVVEYNKLHVYVNGIKQVADLRGSGGASPSPSPASSAVVAGLTPTLTYDIILTVNGVAHTITLPAPGALTPYTYHSLAAAIDALFVAGSIPATAMFDNTELLIFSNTVGLGSEITISGGSLWGAATNMGLGTTFSSTVTANYSYQEVGYPYQTASTVLFNAAPATGTIIEFISSPK